MRRNMRKILGSGIIAIALFSPSVAMALDMEFYTYNGFGPVVSALQKMALIFGAGGFTGLFYVTAFLGVFLGGFALYMKSLMGQRASHAAWAASVLVGVALYLGLIVPKGTLWVYDPVKNKNQAVGGIPDAIVAIAGITNSIERGLVDLVSSTADPVGYQSNSGGTGFDVLYNINSKGVLLADQYVNVSLKNYVRDCVFFELQRPGTSLSVNDLAANMDFGPLIEQAANPAVYTTYYDNFNKTGVATDCRTAWSSINAAITNTASYDTSLWSRCADAGFDPTNVTEFTQCQQLIGNTYSWIQGAAVSVTDAFRQTLVARTLSDVAMSASPDVATEIFASKQAGTSMVSSGTMANDWIPIVRAVLTAITFSLIPILALFVPTPLFGKAASTAAGFFLWLLFWGVIDAMLHQFAMDYAATTFQEVKRYGLGVAAINTFSTASLKTIAAFGSIRWSGLALAALISGMLVKFGGHALATLSGHITGQIQSAGSSAGQAMLSPEMKANTLSSLERAPSVMANANRWDFGQRADARTFETMSRNVTSMGMVQQYGHGSAEGAADVMGGANLYDASKRIGASRAGAGRGESLGSTNEHLAYGGAKQATVNASTLGLGVEQFSAFERGGKILTKDMSDRLNKAHNTNNFEEGMRLSYGVDRDGNLTNVMGEFQTTHDRDFAGGEAGKGYTVYKGASMRAYADGRVTYDGIVSDWGGHDGHIGHEGHMAIGKDGTVKNVSGEAGYNMAFRQDTISEYVNTHRTETGTRVNTGDRVHTGNVLEHSDVDRVVTDHGHQITGALQMAQKGDRTLVHEIVSAKNNATREAEFVNVASRLASDMAFHSRQGQHYDYAQGDGGVSGRMFGVGGSASVGARSQDTVTKNILQQELLTEMKDAYSTAQKYDFSNKLTEEYMADRLQSKVGGVVNDFERDSPNNYGASQPWEAVKNQFSGSGPDLKKSGHDGVKG